MPYWMNLSLQAFWCLMRWNNCANHDIRECSEFRTHDYDLCWLCQYMEHIGAGTRLAHTFIKPLYRLNRPYIVLALMFLLNMGLSICCTESVEPCFAYDGHHLSCSVASWGKSCRCCCSYCYRPFDGCRARCRFDIAHSQDT